MATRALATSEAAQPTQESRARPPPRTSHQRGGAAHAGEPSTATTAHHKIGRRPQTRLRSDPSTPGSPPRAQAVPQAQMRWYGADLRGGGAGALMRSAAAAAATCRRLPPPRTARRRRHRLRNNQQLRWYADRLSAASCGSIGGDVLLLHSMRLLLQELHTELILCSWAPWTRMAACWTSFLPFCDEQ